MKKPSEIEIGLPGGGRTRALAYSAEAPTVGAALMLAHGAGAGQQSPFMVAAAQALSRLGIDVVTFDFPYIVQRRHVPDRAPVLEACYKAAIESIVTNHEPLFIGGKSMGGRIATQVAAADPELPIAGLVLLGYPLHPPGRPDQRRDAHLPNVRRPMLFVQGSRDTFGTPRELEASLASVSPAPSVHVIDGGDHSFKLSRTNPEAQRAIDEDVQRTVVEWIKDAIRDRVGARR